MGTKNKIASKCNNVEEKNLNFYKFNVLQVQDDITLFAFDFGYIFTLSD